MAVELPPDPPIDETRRGVLTISPPALLGLLGIPRDHRVERLHVTYDGELTIELVGADMPEGFLPQPVTLIAHTSREKPLELCWGHKPAKRWTLP